MHKVKQNSTQQVIKKRSLSQLIQIVEEEIQFPDNNVTVMSSIQKQIKKTENSFVPSSGKDIGQLRKLVLNHEYYTSIDGNIITEKYIKLKRTRRAIKKQKYQQQFMFLQTQANPFSQTQTAYLQPQYFNQLQIQNMYSPALAQNLQGTNYDQQLSAFQQNQIMHLQTLPSLEQANSQIMKQQLGQQLLVPQQSLQIQQQQSMIQIQNHSQNGEYQGMVNNYMKMDRVQLSVKKDVSKLDEESESNFSDDYEESSESDQMVYEKFSYTYSYMQNDRKKDITIEHHDLKKLVPNQYLNDTIVNFFLKFFEVEILSQEMKEKVLIFNTYFMSKLAPNDQIEQLSSSSFEVINGLFEKNYQAVRRWIKEDIFEKQFLVFPLNLPEHWSVIIVCNHKNLFDQDEKSEARQQNSSENPTTIDEDDEQDQDKEIKDENSSNKPKKEYNKPCLVYFDSFGLLDPKYSNMIRLYLNKEYETKKKSTIQKNIVYNERTLPSHQPLIPRQTNYVDCGLYLLEYVENFLNDPQQILSLFNNTEFDEWIHLRWFPRCNIHKKRKFIKELLIDLSKLSKEEAAKNYQQKRANLLELKKDNASQYDEIDMEEFEDHIDEIAEYEEDYPNTQEEKHRQLLDFYMNPNFNKYDVV
ncbi:Ulp1 protease family, carboxy-terminal domain protein (macronuclear) [Tetrahymena thermophila SB210]|uniref:Ulp1 protease family, carboxy-terminal domain protein n=1 Tax=Tetrahymena thermophila (strain SB210) TaxID=312017 RepID=Q23G47_TETTS|nr:Ulp1 protease family, carboxy-terminal domain protein [Tetrahymena thermophila SB210]EAR95413.3 Ulp1 protease family, carboxy-terminal domain protein [Tetrahymena thermophila SB210]|eukprot:XP_001015658.3 Ulp1 protease family, carboxy-terminal domain protein [Tetrahymena thermophila SB210]